MRNFTITSVWGIPIRINISLVVFLPVLAWLIGGGGQIAVYAGLVDAIAPGTLDVDVLRTGATPWVIGIAAAIGLFVSVTLHELGHSWVAMRYGLRVESITLWILGGLANLSAIPREWNREFWIAIAGPVTSILVGVACYGFVQVVPQSVQVVVFVAGWLVVMNLTLAAFNLLPAFPMDGGRILRALLARRRPYATATRMAARVGSAFAILFAIVGVLFFQPMLLLLALFIYGAATGESRTVMLAELLQGVTVGNVMRADRPTIPASASIASFFQHVLAERETEYMVVNDVGEAVGVVTLDHLERVAPEDRATVTVGDVAGRDVVRLSVLDEAFEALVALNQARSDVAIVEDAGQPVGVVTTSDFAAVLEMRRRLGEYASIRVPM